MNINDPRRAPSGIKPSLRIDKQRKSLRELAQDTMRQAILEMRFAPGERLIERNLCAELGVSRTVVREVLRFLEAEGLVENTPNGPAVMTVSPDDAAQIFEIRALLEGMAIANCAERATEEDLKLLGQAMADLVVARDTGDIRLSLKATNRFYRIVFETSQKKQAWNIVEGLHLRINALRLMTVGTSGRLGISIGEMQKIYDAIREHDPTAAYAASSEHIAQAAATARRLFSQTGAPQAQGVDAARAK